MSSHRAIPEIKIEILQALVREQRARLAAVGPAPRPPPAEIMFCAGSRPSHYPAYPEKPTVPKPKRAKERKPPESDDGSDFGAGFLAGAVAGIAATLFVAWLAN